MLTDRVTPPPRLHTDEPDLGIGQEGMEDPQGIGSAPDTGDHFVRQPSRPLEHLRPGLASDDGLQVAHDARERVRPYHRPDRVVGGLHVRHPVAQRLVGGVLQGPGA